MKSEFRRSGAEAFDLALRLAGKRGQTLAHIQLRLADLLQRQVPVSAPAISDWRTGQTPVPFEAVAAVCRMAGATLLVKDDGQFEIRVDRPLPERELRPAAGEGRVFMHLIPGKLALLTGLALVVLWITLAGMPTVVDTVAAAAKTVVTAVPGPLAQPAAAVLLPLAAPAARTDQVKLEAANRDGRGPSAVRSTPSPSVLAQQTGLPPALPPAPMKAPAAPVVVAPPAPTPTPTAIPTTLPPPPPAPSPTLPPTPTPSPPQPPPSPAAAPLATPAVS